MKKYKGHRSPADHHWSSNETSCIGIWLHLFELLYKGVQWELPNSPYFCQDGKLLLKNRNSKSPFLKKTPSQIFEHGLVELMPLPLVSLVLCSEQKRKVITNFILILFEPECFMFLR